MNKFQKSMIFAGANLLSLGVSHADATVLAPSFLDATNSGQTQTQKMTSDQMRETEASHLEVFAACKWGHAAFAPVKVSSEPTLLEVQNLFAQMELV